ncbi:hypothetical protein [Streptomyces sp. NPDC101237]|uniref:hypothetical protein n=1 Tax=Streptomyces sp. NPDC101237 TaxID=3366139 RepID=UPI0037F65BAA
MTSPAVPPAPAARPPRTAAGRRALRLALPAGGLVALALLCGGRAHAAEGTPAVPSPASLASRLDVEKLLPSAGTTTDERTTDERTTPAGATPPEAAPPHTDARPTAAPRTDAPDTAVPRATAPHPLAPHATTSLTVTPLTTTPRTDAARTDAPHANAPRATATAAAPPSAADPTAGRRATSPQGPPRPASRTSTAPAATSKPPALPVLSVVPVVGETVRSVTGTVTTTVTATVTGTLDTVVTQGLGEVVRQVSHLPGDLTTLPGQLPAPPVPPGTSTAPPVPVPPAGSAPVPAGSAPGTAAARPAVPEEGRHHSPRTRTAAKTAVPYGPRGTVLAAAPVPGTAAHPHTGGHRAARAFDGPNRPAPAGDTDGALGKSVVDGGSARHGDAYAVTFADRAPLRLVPGTAAHTDAAGTPDRYRDIPVFPG